MIRVESKIEEPDLKEYLYYHQYWEDGLYLPLRIGISLVLGVLCGIAHGEPFDVLMFLGVTVFCVAVFILIPMAKIHMYYKDRVRQDRTGTFGLSQIFQFDQKGAWRIFSDREESRFFPYQSIYRIAERDSVFLCYFEKKLCAIIPKRYIKEEDCQKLREIFRENLGERFRQKASGKSAGEVGQH